MPQLPDAFYEIANQRLPDSDLVQSRWVGNGNDAKRVLEVASSQEGGFTVRVECEPDGLYVCAGGWHGAPFEVGPVTPTAEATAEDCLGFVRTLLCPDSSLEVSYAGSQPYRWVLSYATDAGHERDEVGLFIYNYFGKRSKKVFQNRQLTPRHASSAA